MNWSRTKSIFIVTFLMLNVFLGWQLVEKVQQPGRVANIEQSSDILGRLEENSISLPDGEVNLAGVRNVVLEGGWSSFSEEEVEALTGQEVQLAQSGTTILSEFEKPMDVSNLIDSSNDGNGTGFTQFLTQNIQNGQDYTMSRYDPEENKVYFNQVYNQRETFVNEEEPLILELNDNKEAVGYTQRHFHFEENSGERDMIPYMDAVEALFDNHFIKRNNRIVDIEFGYYSLADQTPRFFSPMWAVKVERTSEAEEEPDNRIYLVNAILGDQHQWYPDESQVEEEEENETEEEIPSGNDQL